MKDEIMKKKRNLTHCSMRKPDIRMIIQNDKFHKEVRGSREEVVAKLYGKFFRGLDNRSCT